MTHRRPRIGVTGIGMATGLGLDAATTFRRLMAGETAIVALEGIAHRCRGTPVASQVNATDLERALGATSRTFPDSHACRLAELAAREAIWQADLEGKPIDLILGGSTGATREGVADCVAQGEKSVLPLVGKLVNHPIGSIGHCLAGAFGNVARSTVLCSACSSGALAISVGAMRLEQGYELPQIVGGADSLNLLTLSGFESLGAMAFEACRPFDEQRRGLNLGEGAGFLVLETELMARRRGASVLVWLDGYAIGAEAHHLTHPDPEGRRACSLICQAIERAGIAAEDIGYVNAHGTATVANDEMECRALRNAFGSAVEVVRVSSSKGQIGHTLAAAGAIEAVIAAQTLIEQAVPPTAGLSQTADACRLLHVPGVGTHANLRAVLSNSFGFGGACAVLAMQRGDQPRAIGSSDESRAPVEIPCSREEATVCVTGLVTLGRAGIRRGSENAAWLDDGYGQIPSVLPFEPLDLLVMERSRRFDRLTALTALGCSFALADAGLSGPTGLDRDRVGLVLGNALGPVGRSAQFVERILERGAKGVSPAEFPHLLPSSVSGNASIYAALRGPVFDVSDVGATMQAALELGINCIRAGTAQAMLVGTTEVRDDCIVQAQRAGVDVGSFNGLADDGAVLLLIESRSSAIGRGALHCELVTSRWLSERSGTELPMPNPATDSMVLLASLGGREQDELLERLGWASVTRRSCAARACDGWSHPGFVLAAGAGLVLAGQCASTLVITSSPSGPHCAVFRRSTQQQQAMRRA
jgi:3-oxoacyl-[acyl-carrier-protein] synthase II